MSDVTAAHRFRKTVAGLCMIGAPIMSVQDMTTSICTCWTSFVVRVISDGAPNRAISWAENVPTRAKIDVRTSRPKAIAVRAPNHTALAAQAICTSVIASIQPPVRTM